MRTLTPDILLQGYAAGVFPMAEHRNDPDVFWVDPQKRGILPLDGFHMSRSLARHMRRTEMTITTDQAFDAVLDACADRVETWINGTIRTLYLRLFERGQAHSLEVWDDGQLVGGVYGVTLGAAFFGESMFSRQTNASKVALAVLVDLLRRGGYCLFDTQFLTDHLASLGAVEISRAQYHARLDDALDLQAAFVSPGTPYEAMQRMTHTS